jgi:hypothetical protein
MTNPSSFNEAQLGVSINGSTPIAGWLEKPTKTINSWMITGGTPLSGKTLARAEGFWKFMFLRQVFIISLPN